jgi:hypothetical protein
MRTDIRWRWARRTAAYRLLLTSLTICGGGVPLQAGTEPGTCQQALITSARPDGLVLEIGTDCVLQARGPDALSVGRLTLPRPDAKTGRLRRVIATRDLLVVLTSHPGRLQVYTLPDFAGVPLVGNVPLREPVDLAAYDLGGDHATLFVVDNPERRGALMGDEPYDGARLLRFRLARHRSARRDVVVARGLLVLDGGEQWGTESQRLESVELEGNELRVSIFDDRHRYHAYLTLDGVLLERERVPSRP